MEYGVWRDLNILNILRRTPNWISSFLMMKRDLSAISVIVKVIVSKKIYKHILNQHIEETVMIVSNVNIVQHISLI